MKVLLHTCCGPCSLTVQRDMESEGYKVDKFYYNPNIHPLTEYRARLASLIELSNKTNSNLVISEKYDFDEFLKRVSQNPKARCAQCYKMRLEETAQKAVDGGYEGFSTTLLVSPYQNHELIAETGEAISKGTGIPFVYKDFRPTFREGQNWSKELGLYRQKYCGCIYSEYERYASKKKP
jgi:predicted adenine nucleotide alpha hydrolase (AANH) superfamily ATPase